MPLSCHTPLAPGAQRSDSGSPHLPRRSWRHCSSPRPRSRRRRRSRLGPPLGLRSSPATRSRTFPRRSSPVTSASARTRALRSPRHDPCPRRHLAQGQGDGRWPAARRWTGEPRRCRDPDPGHHHPVRLRDRRAAHRNPGDSRPEREPAQHQHPLTGLARVGAGICRVPDADPARDDIDRHCQVARSSPPLRSAAPASGSRNDLLASVPTPRPGGGVRTLVSSRPWGARPSRIGSPRPRRLPRMRIGEALLHPWTGIARSV